MSKSAIPTRITATPAAREAISRLRAARGGPLMFGPVLRPLQHTNVSASGCRTNSPVWVAGLTLPRPGRG
jgi:hypothetical protein